MADMDNSGSDTILNRELEFCYQFATYFFTITDVSKELGAGGKTKQKSGLESEFVGMYGYAAGGAAGVALETVLPPSVAELIGKVLAKTGNTLFKKIAIMQLTTERREKHKKIHEVVKNEHLNLEKFLTICIQVALAIFRDNESQFMSVTRKENDGQSWIRAMSKLAEEAAERVFNYIIELTPEERIEFSESLKDACGGSIAIRNAVLSGKCKQSGVNRMIRKEGHKLVTYEDTENGLKKEVDSTTADFFSLVKYTQQEMTTFLEKEGVAVRVQEILDYIIKRNEKLADKHIPRIYNEQMGQLRNALESLLSANDELHERISDIHSAVVSCQGPSLILQQITHGNPLQIRRFMERDSLIKETEAARESGLSVIVFSGQVGTGKTQEAIRYAMAERDNCKVDIIFLQSGTVKCLNDGLREFANSYNLGIPRQSKNVFELIVRRLIDRNVIFILANVSEELVLFQIPLVSMPKSHRVLVTTQVDNLASEEYKVIEVKNFDSDLTKYFFKMHIDRLNENDGDINLLVKEIGTIPMYVQVTCNFLNDRTRYNKNYSIQKFLSQLDSQLVPEYFEGTVDSAHCVNRAGSPIKVWAMMLQNVRANQTVGTVALQILSAISYLQPDHITEEFVKNIFGSQVNPVKFENALNLLARFQIIGRRIHGVTGFIHIYPMVQATIRRLDQIERYQISLEKILNFFIETEEEYDHTEDIFLPPHFHTVFKHALCNELSFSKFRGKLLNLWNSPKYTGSHDRLFQLEMVLSVLEKTLTKSDISDWLNPFNRRNNIPNYGIMDLGIEDFGIKSEVNNSSCSDLYDRIYSKLETKGPNIQLEVVEFVLNRAHYAWNKSQNQLPVEMFKNAYIVALDHCKFTEAELLVLQSFFYMAPHCVKLDMDSIGVIFKAEKKVDLHSIFERISIYYRLDYESGQTVSVSDGQLHGAKAHLENTDQDVPTLTYIASIFLRMIRKKEFTFRYSKYLECVLGNLSNESHTKSIEVQNSKKCLEWEYYEYKRAHFPYVAS